MKKTSITITEAARNFADCVNRAHYQNVTFVLLKNGEPFARLVPDLVAGQPAPGRLHGEDASEASRVPAAGRPGAALAPHAQELAFEQAKLSDELQSFLGRHQSVLWGLAPSQRAFLPPTRLLQRRIHHEQLRRTR